MDVAERNSAKVFMPFLEKEFPALVESYRRRYEGRAFAPKAYSERISQLVRRLRVKYGVLRERDYRPDVMAPELTQAQLSLF